jgi:hypothetical protein
MQVFPSPLPLRRRLNLQSSYSLGKILNDDRSELVTSMNKWGGSPKKIFQPPPHLPLLTTSPQALLWGNKNILSRARFELAAFGFPALLSSHI